MATQQSDQVEWVSEARWVEDGPFYFSSMSETHRVVFCDEMVHSNQFLRLPLRVSNHWKLSRKNQSAVKQCGNAPGG